MGREHTPVERAIEAFGAGRFVLLARETRAGDWRGVLAVPADAVTPETINYLALHARGLVCLALTPQRCRRLGLGLQSAYRGAPAYTVSIEAASGVTTGISAADRARTILVASSPDTGPEDIVSPGHVFPVETHPSGVLVQRDVAEAAVDLARLAGCRLQAAAFCHVLSLSGEEANWEELASFAAEHDTPLLQIAELVEHRMARERVVRQLERGDVPTAFGDFSVSAWENVLDQTHHLLLQLGGVEAAEGEAFPLVRLHSQCLTGDVFASRRCDCGEQLSRALQRIQAEERGALLYLRQEGRGIGLPAKLQAYALQDRGLDTVQANEELGYGADLREYGVGAQILHAAGYRKVRLLTNNPRKIAGLRSYGIEVVRVAHEVEPGDSNRRYLRAKKAKLGHMLESLE